MYKLLWNLTQGQRWFYSAAVLSMALANGFIFTTPLVARAVIDGVIGAEGQTPGVWWQASQDDLELLFYLAFAGLLIIVLTALAGVFQYLRSSLAARAAEAIVRGLRDRLYHHLEHLPCAFHDRADTGDLIQRCTSDVETLRVFLAEQVVEIARTVLLVLMAAPLLFWLNSSMALASMALLPVIFGFALVFFAKIQARFLLTDQAEARMTTVLQENLSGIRVVRAFARQDYEQAKFAAANREHRDRYQQLIRLIGVYWSVSDFFCMAQLGLALLFGAALVMSGDLSVGELFAFLSYLGLIVWPVRHLGRVLTETGKALVALRRLQEILQQPAESITPVTDQAPLGGAIEFDGVSFGYGVTPVFEGLSLRVQPGETVALIGPAGAGKSTLVQLLLRLYDYQHGSIRLDGRELKDLERKFVRARIGVVLQEPFLYTKTIAANLRVGNSRAAHRELETAAAAACIDDAISRFGGGYDTLVGERGVTLSGGQRQRIALARALLKDPPILILDDALSAVDTRTEAHILQALRARRGRRTTLLIAHRLSSVIEADRILVLGGGCIEQSGTHAELINQPGPYQRLWRIQGALEETIAQDLKLADTHR